MFSDCVFADVGFEDGNISDEGNFQFAGSITGETGVTSGKST